MAFNMRVGHAHAPCADYDKAHAESLPALLSLPLIIFRAYWGRAQCIRREGGATSEGGAGKRTDASVSITRLSAGRGGVLFQFARTGDVADGRWPTEEAGWRYLPQRLIGSLGIKTNHVSSAVLRRPLPRYAQKRRDGVARGSRWLPTSHLLCGVCGKPKRVGCRLGLMLAPRLC